MQDLEAELRAKLSGITDDTEEQDAFVSYVKALVLKSYRNGQAVAAKPRSGLLQKAPEPSEQ
jgi:hypothetical protein